MKEAHIWPFPLPCVGAIVIQEQPGGTEYLFIQRKKDPYVGRWALVGGKWDYGETLAEAVIREVKEETTLDTIFTGLHAVVSERFVAWEDSSVAAHYVIFLCALTVIGGIALEQGEGTVAWFTRQEIESLADNHLLAPTDYALLRDFAEATAATPYVDVKVKAALDGMAGGAVEMLQFERFVTNGS
jgi:ADP-ribose pyrophosphatase YjhB (NUDIX family)